MVIDRSNEALDSTEIAPEDEGPSIRQSFGIRSWLQDTLETLLLAAILFFVINTLTGRYQVHGQSMEPSLHDGQYLIASKVTYWLHSPQRGDVVVLDPPNRNSNVPYIKRVIGLPGDLVEVREQRVWVNGIALNEPYISAPPNYTGNWVVGEGEYLVFGDNRNNSSDSHSWGVLPEEHVLGKAFFSYWPPEYWGRIPHYTFPELEAAQ
ncbi:MAG: signal peptidase I [Anaerolineae bacterium]|nr:signal peptidase I [Anaerolineae bacterium]